MNYNFLNFIFDQIDLNRYLLNFSKFNISNFLAANHIHCIMKIDEATTVAEATIFIAPSMHITEYFSYGVVWTYSVGTYSLVSVVMHTSLLPITRRVQSSFYLSSLAGIIAAQHDFFSLVSKHLGLGVSLSFLLQRAPNFPGSGAAHFLRASV